MQYGYFDEIAVRNPQHVNKGVAAVTVDGAELAGNVVPVFEGGVHQVEAILG